jgi:NADPH:quinone reductase-like Zn-dependent oxidoreductase
VYIHIYIIYGFILVVVVYVAAGLRYRSPENKAVIVNQVEKVVWPAIVGGKVKPVVHKSFQFSEAAEAHKLMESSDHIGKILLLP